MINRDSCSVVARIFDAMHNLRIYYRKHNHSIDIAALVLGAIAIFVGLYVDGDSHWLWKVLNGIVTILGGVAGMFYVCGAFVLYFRRRVEFDRLLAQGSYLMRVAIIVMLIPSILSMFFGVVALFFDDAKAREEAPKQYVVVQSVEDGDELRVVEVVDNKSNGLPMFSIFRSVYYHYMDATYQRSVDGGLGRALSAVFAILGVLLLNGLLVSTIIGWVDGRKQRWGRGVIHYDVKHLGERRYAVIIGANEMAAVVIRRLLGGDADTSQNRYVILQTSRDPEAVREELMSHLSIDHMRRIVIYQGLRDSMSEIASLHLESCNEVYILGESVQNDGGDSSHDAMNMRSVNLIAAYIAKHKWHHREDEYTKLKCRVMFEYQTTYQMLQFSDIPARVKENLDFVPFNRYESWARKVMVEGSAFNYMQEQRIDYTPLDGRGIGIEDDGHVHLVVVGMTKMGVAMGIQALLQAHYVNYADSEGKHDKRGMEARRTRITFIDPNASKEMDFFKGRYDNLFALMRHRLIDKTKTPTVGGEWVDPIMGKEGNSTAYAHLCAEGNIYNFLDVEVEFIEGGLEEQRVRDYLESLCDRSDAWTATSKLTIAMCLDDTTQAAATALYMPVKVYEAVQEVWVYQKESADIMLNLKSAMQSDGRYSKLRPFGMLYGGYVDDDEYTQKAILVNSAYSNTMDELVESFKAWTPESNDKLDRCRALLAECRRSWDGCSMADKFSNYYFVDSIPLKLRSRSVVKSDYALSSECFARMEHNRWVIQQLIIGYTASSPEVAKALADAIKRQNTDDAYAKAAAKAEWKAVRNKHRSGIYHMHPCICTYDHIDAVDSGAKAYDEVLNNAIPDILMLVDGIPVRRD